MKVDLSGSGIVIESETVEEANIISEFYERLPDKYHAENNVRADGFSLVTEYNPFKVTLTFLKD